MSSGIYMWTSPSGKQYIGKSIDLERRKRMFLNFSKNYTSGTSLIDKARHKYADSKLWKYVILEECHENQLNEKEKYYIEQYDTYKNGYNSTYGGDGVDGFTRFDKNLKLYKNTKWRKPIVSINIESKEIRYFSSIADCANEMEFKASPIGNVCRHNFETYKGYVFMYLDEYRNRNKRAIICNIIRKKKHVKKLRGNKTKVLKISLETNRIVKEYDSISEAAKEIGVKNGVAISNCCRGVQKTAYGYKWRYKNL